MPIFSLAISSQLFTFDYLSYLTVHEPVAGLAVASNWSFCQVFPAVKG